MSNNGVPLPAMSPQPPHGQGPDYKGPQPPSLPYPGQNAGPTQYPGATSQQYNSQNLVSPPGPNMSMQQSPPGFPPGFPPGLPSGQQPAQSNQYMNQKNLGSSGSSTLSDQPNMPGPMSANQQNMSSHPPLPNQQNMAGHPPLPNQQNMAGHTPLPNQQNMASHPPLPNQQNMPGSALSNQRTMASSPGLPNQPNMSGTTPPNQPTILSQPNMSGSTLANQRSMSNSPAFPNQPSMPGSLPGQKNMFGSLPGQQKAPGQSSMTGPAPGQQNTPGAPSAQQNAFGSLPGQQNMPDRPSVQQNVLGSFPGQKNMPGSLPGPQGMFGSLPGQQNMPSSLPAQQNSQGLVLGQQNMSGSIPGKQNMPGSLPGHQNMTGPLHPNHQNIPGPPLPGQQNLSGPLLPGQLNMSGPPVSEQPNMSGPAAQRQANLSGPPLPGQRQNFPHSMPGQMPGHYPGQHNLQPHLTSQMQGANQGYSQGNQRSMMAGPPLPGQALTSPPGGRQPPPPGFPQPPQPGYQQPGAYPPQQGFAQTDMYGGQRPYDGSGQPYQPGVPPQQQPRRLDPDHMPSPIQVIQDDQRSRGGDFITNQKGLVPPLVTTKFVVHDQGNASPRFIRSTMYTVPTNADMIKQTNVPFGLILSPMAQVEDGEYEPPIIDMGEMGPVRCARCKAYMCSFMQFTDAGRRFQCMFCKVTTDVPAEYFQHLDHTGQRMDRHERPELMLGTYEFLATQDYCRNNVFPKPPAIVFVIDVSYNTMKSGLVNLLCRKMKDIIRNLPVDVGQSKSNMKVGFITYNNTVHFYNIKSCLAQPQMMVVGDVQDVFVPLLDGFLCDPEESEAVIDSLMTQIPIMFKDTRETEVILAPAIQAGLEALKASECAGKLMVFHSSLPNADAPGKLKNRDDRKLLGTDKEKTVLVPQNTVYNTLGQDCVASACSVDLFVFNNSYCDIATISQVARLTGGEVFKYTYFQAEPDGERLITDIINNISKPIAFDAVMRIRTSTGVRATDFFGHFYMSNTTDMDIASIDCDKAIAVEIKHDDKLTDDEGVYIQAALLYTSCSGIRRLRIINLSLRTSSQLAELYRTCELDAIVNFFAKQSVFKLLESNPKAVKDSLVARCANMLAVYRKHCASPSSTGQLILPECMKLLPLYINCLLKSDALNGGADMSIDDRSFIMQAVSVMPIKSSVTYFYPRLIALHDVDPQGDDIPPMIRCSLDKFNDDGAYLLENGIHMFIWLGMGLSQQWVQAVFGAAAVTHIDTERSILPVLDTPLSKRVNDIVARIRAERRYCMRLTLIRQRDKLEIVMRHFLVEDQGNDRSSSYVDFLCHMHREIRALLS